MLTRTDRQRYVFGWGWGLPSLLLLGLILAWACLGCQSHPPTRTPLQAAYALYGQFVILEEEAARLSQDPATPASVKHALQQADARAHPSANALLQATLDVNSAVRALNEGTGTPETVKITQDHLAQWMTQAETDLLALINAVQGH